MLNAAKWMLGAALLIEPALCDADTVNLVCKLGAAKFDLAVDYSANTATRSQYGNASPQMPITITGDMVTFQLQPVPGGSTSHYSLNRKTGQLEIVTDGGPGASRHPVYSCGPGAK